MNNLLRIKMKVAIVAIVLSAFLLNFSSCYNNKADVTPPDYTVSFSKQVVPIFKSGPCGCHNTLGATNTPGSALAVRFSNGNFNGNDTVLYDAILARVSVMEQWVNGGHHPGGGDVFLSPSETTIIKSWIAQGAEDDRSVEPETGAVTFTKGIAQMVNTTCSASSCHGGVAVSLTYQKLVGDADVLRAMISNRGATGHPGGKLSLSASTWSSLQAWVAGGQPQ